MNTGFETKSLLTLCEIWASDSRSLGQLPVDAEAIAAELIEYFIRDTLLEANPSDDPEEIARRVQASWLGQFVNLDNQPTTAFEMAFEWFAEGGNTELKHRELVQYAKEVRLTRDGLELFCDQEKFSEWAKNRGLKRPTFIDGSRQAQKLRACVTAIRSLIKNNDGLLDMPDLRFVKLVNDWFEDNQVYLIDKYLMSADRRTVGRALDVVRKENRLF
jgi:hypothetical protein